MLLYAMLHLAGFDVTLDDLRSFRQYGSKTPGHPEFHDTPGVEATTGPLGQGIANAVGMALAQRMLAARFNAGGTFPSTTSSTASVSDGDLMEGVASEACSLAGHLKLGNLVFLYDDNHDLARRPHRRDLHRGPRQALRGLRLARAARRRTATTSTPSTRAITRGQGGPAALADRASRTHHRLRRAAQGRTPEAHGSPLGKEEIEGGQEEPGLAARGAAFLRPREVRAVLRGRIEEQKKGTRSGRGKFARMAARQCRRRRGSGDALSRQLPDGSPRAACRSGRRRRPKPPASRPADRPEGRRSSCPRLVGGSADLDPSTLHLHQGRGRRAAGQLRRPQHPLRRARARHGRDRQRHALYGGFVPYGATFLIFSRLHAPGHPARRAHRQLQRSSSSPTTPSSSARTGPRTSRSSSSRPCALSQPGSVASGRRSRDRGCMGGGHRPQGRAQAFAFSRQKSRPCAGAGPPTCARRCAAPMRWWTCPIPTWSSSPPAAKSRSSRQRSRDLQGGHRVRLVSMPCVERFLKWPGDEQRKLIPHGKARLVAVEASGGLDWYRIIGDGLVVGIDRFGASAPEKALADAYDSRPPRLPPASGAGWPKARARTPSKENAMKPAARSERVRAERMARPDRPQVDPRRRALPHVGGGRHPRRHRESRHLREGHRRVGRIRRGALRADRQGQAADGDLRGAGGGRRARRLRRAAAPLRSAPGRRRLRFPGGLALHRPRHRATVAEAKRFWKAVDRPNLFIKIPANPEGIPPSAKPPRRASASTSRSSSA